MRAGGELVQSAGVAGGRPLSPGTGAVVRRRGGRRGNREHVVCGPFSGPRAVDRDSRARSGNGGKVRPRRARSRLARSFAQTPAGQPPVMRRRSSALRWRSSFRWRRFTRRRLHRKSRKRVRSSGRYTTRAAPSSLPQPSPSKIHRGRTRKAPPQIRTAPTSSRASRPESTCSKCALADLRRIRRRLHSRPEPPRR
jgi:hypothetical protein